MAKISREEVSNAQQQFELPLLTMHAKDIYWPPKKKSS